MTPSLRVLGTGPERAMKAVLLFRSAFPDLRITIEDLFAEGDRAMVRWTFQGTHTGELFGVRAQPNENHDRWNGYVSRCGWQDSGVLGELGHDGLHAAAWTGASSSQRVGRGLRISGRRTLDPGFRRGDVSAFKFTGRCISRSSDRILNPSRSTSRTGHTHVAHPPDRPTVCTPRDRPIDRAYPCAACQ